MPYDKIGQITYLFCLNIVDVASRYKVLIPIGAYSVKDRQGILTSKTIARALKENYGVFAIERYETQKKLKIELILNLHFFQHN